MRSIVPVALAIAVVAATPVLAAIVQVNISGFTFSPSTANAAPGDSVRWTNLDSATHTATSYAVPAHFNTGNILPGASSIVSFPTAGSYPYWCNIHKTMRGVVQVGPNTAPTPSITLAPSSTVSGVVTLTGDVADVEGPDTWVRVQVDTNVIYGAGTLHGLGVQTAPTTHAWSVNWDTTLYTNGPHTITVRGDDGAHPTVTLSIPVTVFNAGAKPDFKIQNVISSGLVARTIRATVLNDGPAASVATTIEFAIYRPDLTREVIGTAVLPALNPGQTATPQVDWDATGKFGTWIIEAVADPLNSVTEMDETNNVRQGQTVVLIPGPATDVDDLV